MCGFACLGAGEASVSDFLGRPLGEHWGLTREVLRGRWGGHEKSLDRDR